MLMAHTLLQVALFAADPTLVARDAFLYFLRQLSLCPK